MNKLFSTILVLSLLLSGNAYAAENYKCISVKDIYGIYPKQTVDLVYNKRKKDQCFGE